MKSDYRSIATLHDLFDFDIRRFIYAEIVLKKHLSSWIEKANSLTLKTSLQVYLDYLKQNVQQFETLLKSEEILSLSLSNKIMQAFIEETEEKWISVQILKSTTHAYWPVFNPSITIK